MTTIFNYIDDLLFNKKRKFINIVNDDINFNQFMINRWASMYSPVIAKLLNNTTNRLSGCFETKEQFYKFIDSIIPKLKFKRLYYIKKIKHNKEDDPEHVDLLAKRLELSQREIKLYYEFQNNCSTSPSQSK